MRKQFHKLLNPTNFNEAVFLTAIFLKLSGLFPYRWVNNQYQLSTSNLFITIVHVVFFSSVNVKLIIKDIEEYSAPVIYNNPIAIAGQFILKMLGVLITLAIFWKVIFDNAGCTKALTIITDRLNQLEAMKVNIRPIYRRIFMVGVVQTVAIIFMSAWTLADGIIFYEKINQDCPTIGYFFVAIMSNFYKYCGLMNTFTALHIIYSIINFINSNFEEEQKEMFAAWLEKQKTFRSKIEISSLQLKDN